MKQLFKKTEERERFGNKILTKRNKRSNIVIQRILQPILGVRGETELVVVWSNCGNSATSVSMLHSAQLSNLRSSHSIHKNLPLT